MNDMRVFLTGKDGHGWAIDEDLKLTRQALSGIVQPAGLPECRVIHGTWWEELLQFAPEELKGKRIVCNLTGDPFRYMSLPRFRYALSRVGCWIARSRQAASKLEGVGIRHTTIPYAVDTSVFAPLAPGHRDVTGLRTRWHIPDNSYLIGSFQRDTEGADTESPKLVKGPDILLEIVSELSRRGAELHVVLAGPRRGWIREQLRRRAVAFTYIGQEIPGDDYTVNRLNRTMLNLLYNMVDVCLITSRSEGGPHGVMEAAASRCKILSTAVGHAEDILERDCIFSNHLQAADMLLRDMETGSLAATVDPQYRRLIERNTPAALRPLFRKLYEDIESIPAYHPPVRAKHKESITEEKPTGMQRGPIARFIQKRFKKKFSVSLWHTFYKPPYGGGNQFMLALSKALKRHRVFVQENTCSESLDACLLNSIHFDVERFEELSRNASRAVVHRIDGPIFLIRGFDREKDELCLRINAEYAQATVLQSAWTYQRLKEMGFDPVNPVIIHNAVDPEVFHRRGKAPFARGGKIRLISTSWSSNQRKGAPLYRWIENNLDWNRFEYTFVGNVQEPFRKIRQIQPVSSRRLGDILRDHDIYITASRNDPCSNALIEALACGLPALYLNDGGHPELVGQGGLAFNEPEDILPQLDTIAEHYCAFQNLIVVQNLDDVAERYLALLEEVSRSALQ